MNAGFPNMVSSDISVENEARWYGWLLEILPALCMSRKHCSILDYSYQGFM